MPRRGRCLPAARHTNKHEQATIVNAVAADVRDDDEDEDKDDDENDDDDGGVLVEETPESVVSWTCYGERLESKSEI